MNRTLSSSSASTIIVRQTTLEEVSRYIYAIVFPLIFLFGLVGNVLSALIFSVTKLNKSSCGFYFLVLAIADTIALIGGIHHCLTIGYHVPVPSAAYCRARDFLLYTSMDLVSWMIVAISVDRCLKTKYPISARTYATRRLSIIVSTVLIVFFVGKNIHLATEFIGDFSDDAADNCDGNPDFPSYLSFYKNVWPWIDLVSYALLPFIIVAVCNGLIIHDQYKRRVKIRKRDLDISMITLLLVSSVSLIVSNLPIAILAVIYPYVSMSYDTNEQYDGAAFAFDLLRLPSYASLGLNFYLYYYNSTNFRQQLIFLLRTIFCREKNNEQIELPNLIYSTSSRFDDRLDSIEENDENLSVSNRNFFISNFYKENSP